MFRPTCSTSHANTNNNNSATTIFLLNKFVRRLYDMVKAEQDKGVVEWRRGLLVLHSMATFTKHILPKFFNTRNFKTFRRQLNYYGFVHVRSFSNTAAVTTTALWVHQVLNIHDTKGIRKQKFIGTRKHNSEVVKMGGEQVTKDSVASTRDVAIKNIQGTSLYTMSDDIGGDDTKGKRRGKVNGCVAPRSYQDVVVNGKICQATT